MAFEDVMTLGYPVQPDEVKRGSQSVALRWRFNEEEISSKLLFIGRRRVLEDMRQP
ncbi:Pyridoxal phosphate phosphatase [Sesbania bispinosa]|nr:Pyridoxal phosphate phosphatase [Sesbania bispinosa]